MGGERLPASRGGPFIGAVVFGGTCCCCVGDKLVVLLTILALLLFVVGVVDVVTWGAAWLSLGSLTTPLELVSMASEPKFVVRVLSWTFCASMELRGDETAVVAVGDDAVLFSMLLLLLLLLISPLVTPIRFSVECRRLPGAGSVLRLPLDGLCSMLVIVDERDGPGGVSTTASVPF